MVYKVGIITSKDKIINIRKNDPSGCWWPPAYPTWTPTMVSFSFSVSLIVAQFTIFGSFLGPELREPF